MSIVRENQIRRGDLDAGMANVPWDLDQGFELYVDTLTGEAGDYAHWQGNAFDFDWQCNTPIEQRLSDEATVLTGIPVRLDSPPSIYSEENIRLGGRGLRYHPNDVDENRCFDSEKKKPCNDPRYHVSTDPDAWWVHNRVRYCQVFTNHQFVGRRWLIQEAVA